MTMRFLSRYPAIALATALSVAPCASAARRDLNFLLITIDTLRATGEKAGFRFRPTGPWTIF
jgi:hypothetical protein